MKCKNESCQNEFTTKYSKWSNGLFCSKKCACSHKWSEEHKRKLSLAALNSVKVKRNCQHLRKKYNCIICGDEYIGFNRYKKCDKCKFKVAKYTHNPINLFDLSSRTVTKIFDRAKKGCSICGWNKATCDIHHIISKKRNGADTHDNLIYVCPNCHRMLHKYGDDFMTIEKQLELNIVNTFADWQNFYNIS